MSKCHIRKLCSPPTNARFLATLSGRSQLDRLARSVLTRSLWRKPTCLETGGHRSSATLWRLDSTSLWGAGLHDQLKGSYSLILERFTPNSRASDALDSPADARRRISFV